MNFELRNRNRNRFFFPGSLVRNQESWLDDGKHGFEFMAKTWQCN